MPSFNVGVLSPHMRTASRRASRAAARAGAKHAQRRASAICEVARESLINRPPGVSHVTVYKNELLMQRKGVVHTPRQIPDYEKM